MTLKKIYSLLLILLISLSVFPEVPAGYYIAASGKSAATLKTALFQIIHSHIELTYSALWTAFQTTDKRSDGKVWDIYSDIPGGTPSYLYSFGENQCGSYSTEGDCYNREHSFPKSWFGDATPMYTDLFHIYPTDGYVNGKRSNYPYGEVGVASFTSTNGSKLGQNTFAGYTGTVFEPIDSVKGDLARTYFYMATCYDDKIATWASNSEAQPILAGNSYPAFQDWVVNLLLKWSREDPVSQKEIDRNNAIYAIQGNRNPYIDYPELSEYVWGTKTSDAFVLADPVISVEQAAIAFGKNTPGTSSTKTIALKAYNITGDLSLVLSGKGASSFTLNPLSVVQDSALNGVNITITYSSSVVSKDTANLTISGGGAADVIVPLTGQSSNDFQALSATNVTANSFTANWTKSDNATGYILDVYQVTQTGAEKQVIFDYNFSDGFPSSWSLGGYTNSTEVGGAIRLASGSNYGTITTTAIGSSVSSVLTVNAKQYSNDAGAPIYVSVGGTNVDTLTTSTSFQDFSVEIPEGNTSSTITLTAFKKARVYVSGMSLETEGITAKNTSIEGFPVTLGNVLIYTVSNLSANNSYYYAVTPIGGDNSISSAIAVTTLESTASIGNKTGDDIKINTLQGGIKVNGISDKSRITIFDISGRVVRKIDSNASLFIPLDYKGGYIVTVDADVYHRTFKIIY